MEMRRWKRRAWCCMGGATSGVSSPQASEVGVPCCQGTQCWVVGSHSKSGHISGCISAWYLFGSGPSEGGIVYGLFSKEALYIGKASVNRAHSLGLATRLTEHIWCLYRPGL